MEIHRRPIEERIDWLFDLARRHGEAFRSPDSWLSRERYLAKHPTAIAVLKCMDGRINIPVATQTPVGILMPFRNLGGMFDLGWPHLGEVLAHYVQRMVTEGRRVLILITYHYSKGDPRRGCAGFGHDTAAALAHTREIRGQVEHIFGVGHATVYPLVCGFETDEDALTLHGNGTLSMADLKDVDRRGGAWGGARGAGQGGSLSLRVLRELVGGVGHRGRCVRSPERTISSSQRGIPSYSTSSVAST
jgi:hypothetical protein